MTPDRWKRVEQLYHSALDRPQGEWPEYLRRACPDDAELRKEVEELLRQEPLCTLERPALEALAGDLVSGHTESLAGQTLGAVHGCSIRGIRNLPAPPGFPSGELTRPGPERPPTPGYNSEELTTELVS